MDWRSHPRIVHAAHCLHRGGVVAYPTEAVWGLGCDPLDEKAVSRILALKGRPVTKGMILIAADSDTLLPYLGTLEPSDLKRLREPAPRPVTWVVPAHPEVPDWLTGGRRSLAVRVTRHAVAAALCRAFGGPLVSTSANPGGRAPARTALRVRQYFGERIDALVPGTTGGAARPTEIRDLQSGEVLRPG